MAKITREAVKKMNDAMSNGWKVDLWHLLNWNEKQAELRVYNPEQTMYIRATMSFRDKTENYRRVGKEPVLHISKWFTDGQFNKSYGLGKMFRIGEVQNRAMFSKIQKLTADYTPEKILEMAKGAGITLDDDSHSDGRIL